MPANLNGKKFSNLKQTFKVFMALDAYLGNVSIVATMVIRIMPHYDSRDVKSFWPTLFI